MHFCGLKISLNFPGNLNDKLIMSLEIHQHKIWNIYISEIVTQFQIFPFCTICLQLLCMNDGLHSENEFTYFWRPARTFCNTFELPFWSSLKKFKTFWYLCILPFTARHCWFDLFVRMMLSLLLNMYERKVNKNDELTVLLFINK